jgi:dihydrofolate reductase
VPTVYLTATSLDGFLATSDHSLDWLFEVPGSDEAEEDLPDFMQTVGAIAMGASTYEWVVRHESLVEHPEKWQEWYPGLPAWVFTHRDLPVVRDADIRFTHAPVDQVHAQMSAAAAGRDLWLMGGGDLAGQFADAGLLDRLVVTVAPVTLGAGAPLLPRAIGSDRLTLTDVARTGQFARLTYQVRSPA